MSRIIVFKKNRHLCRHCVLLCLVLVMFFSACASAKLGEISSGEAPTWVSNVRTDYPDREWLAVVGYAPDRMGAENAAIAQLTKTIKQKVDAETSARQTLASSTSKSTASLVRDYTSTIKTKAVLDEIVGIQIREVWTDKKGTVYALAALNRDEAGRYYSNKVMDYERAITSEIAHAVDNEATFEAVNALLRASKLSAKNNPFLDILSVVNPSSYARIELSYKSSQAVEVLASRELEKIIIGVSVIGDVNGRLLKAFETEIAQSGFKTKKIDDTAISLPYLLSISLSFDDATPSTEAKYQFVRFTVNADLKDSRNDKIVLPYSIHGREAHNSLSEARQRAIRTIESEIAGDYVKKFVKLVYTD